MEHTARNTGSVAVFYNDSSVFRFERDFNVPATQEWMKANWSQCYYYICIYLLVVFGGRRLMTSRARFELRGLLFVWNVALATFSLLGALRTIPEFVGLLRTYGFYQTVCVGPVVDDHSNAFMFWIWAFAWSKVPELGDTLFIVLRKQPLIFLHWYHHISVLVFAWYTVAELLPQGRWFMVMNYSVHTFMYSYYALKALRFRVPRAIGIAITAAQLLQMVVGMYVNYWSLEYSRRGSICQASPRDSITFLLIYASYLVLFMRFFYISYFKKRCTGSCDFATAVKDKKN